MVESWRVVRIDDNGNRFVVAEFQGRAEAERVANEMNARGHKQVYWVEPGGEREPLEEMD